MARSKPLVFLARASYRQRRLRDASRLLPILGILLLVLPLLWMPDLPGGMTAGDVVYFFSVWLFLIGVAAAFAPGINPSDGAEDEED